MKASIYNHPCFNDAVRHLHGRIHLPVAPRCNIQCNFCNRKFDCVNESRPGVTSHLLNPGEALKYLAVAMNKHRNISVVGIAGPGDPFANPRETMETLRLVREQYPDMLLCVATNGLNILPYIDELAEIMVSHVTITVNAVETGLISSIYSWIRYNKRVLRSEEGGNILLKNQFAAIRELKKHDILVKINTIIIPGINDHHISEVAKTAASLGADIFNPIPLYKNEESAFSHIDEPSPDRVVEIRREAEQYLPQMHHCTRCRADAVGLLGDKEDMELMKAMGDIKKKVNTRKLISANIPEGKSPTAVATMEGVLVNQHLGEARELSIFSWEDEGPRFIEKRPMPEPGSGDKRWEDLARAIGDCGTLLVSGIGEKPRKLLEGAGIRILVLEGVIETALNGIYTGSAIEHMIKRTRTSRGQSCSGSAGGCG